MIVVIPDGWTSLGCGQWVDSPVSGNFEQYVLHDVVSYVDDNYRTLPRPRVAGRARLLFRWERGMEPRLSQSGDFRGPGDALR